MSGKDKRSNKKRKDVSRYQLKIRYQTNVLLMLLKVLFEESEKKQKRTQMSRKCWQKQDILRSKANISQTKKNQEKSWKVKQYQSLTD